METTFKHNKGKKKKTENTYFNDVYKYMYRGTPVYLSKENP